MSVSGNREGEAPAEPSFWGRHAARQEPSQEPCVLACRIPGHPQITASAFVVL